MSSPGEQPPQFPVPSEHDAFLASLEQRELVEIGSMFSEKDAAWRLVLRRERIARERAVEDIKLYVPPAESPAYDPEAGPEGYMEQVRQLNLSTTINYGTLSLKQEKQQLRQIADRYVNSYPDIVTLGWNVARLLRGEMAEFFHYNLSGIALPSRMVGLMAFESQKYKTVRRYMPDTRINAGEIRVQIRDQQMTRADIEAASQAVWELPHTTPLPDFFQMTPDQQGAIVAALGDEWQELCMLLARHDPDALGSQALRKEGALAHHFVAKLKEAIEQNSLIKPHKLCRHFLRDPKGFDTTLTAARNKVERDRQLLAAREAHRTQLAERQGVDPESLLSAQETRAMSENLREIEQLTNDSDVKDGVLDVAYGVPFPLTEPDKLVIGPTFDEIANKHTELIGRALWEMMPDKNPNGVRLDRWKDFDIGAALRYTHRGNMRNLTVSLMPVTAEELASKLKSYDPETTRPENALRLIFTADMKPTGRKAEQVYLNMILTVTRSPKGRDIIKKNKYAARATGADVALSMRLDAEARARAAEVRSWKAPALRGGLPSVGRHETSTQQKR